MKNMFENKIILITGGTGSWGQELTKQILTYNPKEIRIYDTSEMKEVEMKRRFNDPRLKFIVGDVRSEKRVDHTCRNIDYIFHLAALKHVPVCEENPEEAISINILGTQNVVECAIHNNVKKMINVSTDKAVDPINLYGATKACAEKLTIAANLKTKDTSFVCVRGGNVMGSAGSVIPLFRKQLAEINKITLTDKRMSRFNLSLEEAIKLLLNAAEKSVGGEIFVMKMPAIKVVDLAEVMAEELGNEKTKIETIGIRPGEKIDEVLVSRYEINRVIEDGNFYIILPYLSIPQLEEHYKNVPRKELKEEFSSKNTRILTKSEIREVLSKYDFLKPDLNYDFLINNLSKEQLERLSKKEKWVI
jgi:FlaA1/EpsC-like NDP-sugar epimerase